MDVTGRLSGGLGRAWLRQGSVDATGALAAGGSWRRIGPRTRVLLAALALGWGTDQLFYGRPLGISVPLFVLLLLAALLTLGRWEGVRAARRNLWLVAPLLFFAAMVGVRANGFLTVLNLAAVAGLGGLLAFFYAAGRVERLGLAGYPAVLYRVWWATLVRPAPVVAGLGRAAATHRGQAQRVVPLLRGVALAIPVLLVFTILLASADTFFARYVGDALRLDRLADLPELLWRLVRILAVAWLVTGGLLYALSRHRFWPHAEAQTVLPGAGEPARRLGFVEAATVLGLVDLLFLVFAWTQFTYLFGGRAAATMPYEAYRLYARRGFGELLAVTVLTMCLILGLRWVAARKSVGQVVTLNALSALMIALAGVMLVSAFQRMLAWERVEFYINTQTRLYVRWFIIWLAVTYAWLLGTLWVRQDRFAIGGFVAALGFLVSLNLANPDADVAAYNLSRRDELSTRYLALLSDDAVPALAAGLEAEGLPEDVRRRLRDDLARRLDRLAAIRQAAGWPSFHVSRWQAYRTLRALQEGHKIG